MSPTTSPRIGEGVTTSQASGEPRQDAPDASGPKAWPSADRESPAGPIQLLSVPPQPAPRAARPPAREPDVPPMPVAAPEPAPIADVGAANRPPLTHSLGGLAFGLFELQQPDPTAPVRTLEEARATPGHGREDERRGSGPRADAFAMLGEIDFLDF